MRGTSYWPLYDFLSDDSRTALEEVYLALWDKEHADDAEREEDAEAEPEAEGGVPALRPSDGPDTGVPGLSP
jgi:hypothetical protein